MLRTLSGPRSRGGEGGGCGFLVPWLPHRSSPALNLCLSTSPSLPLVMYHRFLGRQCPHMYFWKEQWEAPSPSLCRVSSSVSGGTDYLPGELWAGKALKCLLV